MRTFILTGVFFACVACHGDPLGKPCDKDEDCGPGYDCFPDVCVQVCTKDDECRGGETCYRYHCIVPGEHPRSRKAKRGPLPNRPTGAVTPPPVPDVTAAELRAIRRELELLRREQARLVDLVQKMQTDKMPPKTKKPPKKAGAVAIEKK
ncbi:hypothetical protein ACFL6C_09605 [Myxococcota bacterium]